MNAASFMSQVLMPFGPRLPLERLAEEVNKLTMLLRPEPMTAGTRKYYVSYLRSGDKWSSLRPKLIPINNGMSSITDVALASPRNSY